MSIPLPIPGFRRLLVRSGPDAHRELILRDGTGEELLWLQGTPSTHRTAKIRDAGGRTVFRVVGHRVGDRRRVTVVDGEGGPLAELDTRRFDPGSGQLLISMSSGAEWHCKGDFAAAAYSASMAGERILRVSRRADGTRIMDLDPDVDPGLALSVVWVADLLALEGSHPYLA